MGTDCQGRVTCDWCNSPYKKAKEIPYYSKYYNMNIKIRLCEECQAKNNRIQKGDY